MKREHDVMYQKNLGAKHYLVIYQSDHSEKLGASQKKGGVSHKDGMRQCKRPTLEAAFRGVETARAPDNILGHDVAI